MPLAFRSVHYDFRSRNGFQWPFPGQTAEAVGPFDPDNMTGCPSYDGDGICLGTSVRQCGSSGRCPQQTRLRAGHGHLAEIYVVDQGALADLVAAHCGVGVVSRCRGGVPGDSGSTLLGLRHNLEIAT